MLPDGNFLIAFESGAVELIRAKQVRWEYKAAEKTEVHAGQPLPDGRVLPVECRPNRVVEVDRAREIAREIMLPPPPAPIKLRNQFRSARQTAAGRYLVSRKGENQIEELDGAGRSLRRIPVTGLSTKSCNCRTATCWSRAAMVTRSSKTVRRGGSGGN